MVAVLSKALWHASKNRILYAELDDIFDIAAMYAVAIARGHVFNDANKRTAHLLPL
jgi:death-on-curing family protein